MLTDLRRVVDFDLCAMIILIIVFITLLFRRIVKIGSDRYLIWIVIILFFTTLLDFTAELFGTVIPASPDLYGLRCFVCYAYNFLRNLHAPLYLIYVIKTSDIEHSIFSNKPLVFLGLLPFSVATVALFSNFFTGDIFRISDQLIYSRGPKISVLYFCNSIYVAMSISLLVTYRKLFTKEKFFALVSMYPMNITAIIIQILFPKLLLEMLAAALAVLFIVIEIRSNEEMQDQILGVFNYRSFNAETKKIMYVKKPVNVVLVNLLNWKSIYSILGNENCIVLLRRFKTRLEDIFKKHGMMANIYYLEQGFFVAIDGESSSETVWQAAEAIDEYILEDTVINQIFLELNAAICCVSCPDDIDKYPEFLKFVDNFRKFVTDTKGVATVKDIVNNRDFRLKNELSEIIANAIMNKSFKMYYQPIYSTEKNAFIAAEAFIRLEHETYGFIPPSLFIAAAEVSGAIHQIWDIIIEDICRFVSKNELRVIGFEHIDINISEIQFMETDFSEKLERSLRKYKVKPSMLAFELKETAIMNEQPAFVRNIKRLDALGINFSLDDYGTGISNMCRITQSPVSVIKMDRQFITKTISELDNGILKNTISLIKQAGIKTLAEGVEDKETADLLTSMGCDYLQGYYYSRPLSEDAFMEKFHSFSADEFF